MVDEYDAGRLSGEYFEGSGLVVVGESGSGKPTEINYTLARLVQDRPALECGLETSFIQLTLVSETTDAARGAGHLADPHR